MFKTQPLGACECDLMGNRAFVDVNQVGAKMTGWALHLITEEAYIGLPLQRVYLRLVNRSKH